MARLLTALVGTPLLLAAVFLLPGEWFLGVMVLIFTWAALEYVEMARAWAPGAPLRWLLVLVPVAGIALALGTHPEADEAHLLMLVTGLFLTLGVTALILTAGTPVKQALPALGAFTFGIPYFGLGIAAPYRLQQVDPWLLVLGLAVVFLGDTAAFYVGSAVGRHKMAPVVSPNKSWEGAAASLAAAVGAAAVWGWLRLGETSWEVLVVGVATGVAAQLGDLLESLLKRGSGIKDSGNVLPGHGGMFDRADAVLVALPMLLACVLLLGPEHFLP